jgi:hypothetical protein
MSHGNSPEGYIVVPAIVADMGAARTPGRSASLVRRLCSISAVHAPQAAARALADLIGEPRAR